MATELLWECWGFPLPTHCHPESRPDDGLLVSQGGLRPQAAQVLWGPAEGGAGYTDFETDFS